MLQYFKVKTTMLKEDNNIEIFRLKKLFKRLQQVNINGSVITLVIPSRKSIVDLTKALKDEKGKASNIKDKNNRNSVIQALGAALQRLKYYSKIPDNGLVLFCGNVLEQGSKTQKRFVYDFEPYKPINFSIYSCAGRFQLEQLKKQLLIAEPAFGFIVVDGEGALYATLQGNTKQILTTIKAELGNSHNKGGQSQLRFSRLHKETRHNILRKVCQTATKCFMMDNKCNVVGLILAGSADFKNQLYNTQMFDPRLKAKVIKVLDVAQGFENGLNSAIQKSSQILKNNKYIEQSKLIEDYFNHIARADNLVVSGIQETMRYVEAGAIKRIVCYENLNILRVPVRNPDTEEILAIYVKPENIDNPDCYRGQNGQLYRIQNEEQQLLVEWIAEHYRDFGCEVEFISDRSEEGAQFVRNFGGFGGFLRYKVELDQYQTDLMLDEAEEFI